MGRGTTATALDAGMFGHDDRRFDRLNLDRGRRVEQGELVGIDALGLGAEALLEQIADLLFQESDGQPQGVELAMQRDVLRHVIG